MSSLKTPYLPKLKPTANLSITRAGEWEEYPIAQGEGSSLYSIGEAIASTAKDDSAPEVIQPVESEIRAGIPDVWASVLMFELAFQDKTHIEHNRAVNEWRSLLTIIALSEVLNYKISAKEAILQSNVPNIPTLARVLIDSRPNTTTLNPNQKWTSIYLLIGKNKDDKNKPFGLITPTTLVAPSVEYSFSSSKISWYRNNLLYSPTDENTKLSVSNKSALASWLLKLKERLKNALEKTDDIKNTQGRVISELDRFIESISVKEQDVQFNEGSLGITGDIYGSLDFCVKKQNDDISTSEVKIIPSVDLLATAPALILNDISVEKTLGKRANEIHFTSNQTLEQFRTNPQIHPQSEFTVVNSDDFFFDKIAISSCDL